LNFIWLSHSVHPEIYWKNARMLIKSQFLPKLNSTLPR